jgi:hypothetical protein
MKAYICSFVTIVTTLTLLLLTNLPDFVGRAQSDNAVTACNSLKELSQNSNNWAEVVAYKNAFEFAKARATQKTSIAVSERYFHDLSARYSGQRIVFCMSLTKEPLRDCGFRNNETQDSLIELIQRKIERDKLSVDDLYEAIDNARPKKKTTEYKPLNRQ